MDDYLRSPPSQNPLLTCFSKAVSVMGPGFKYLAVPKAKMDNAGGKIVRVLFRIQRDATQFVF